MSATLATAPLRYHPAVEAAEEDEAATGQSINETFHGIAETTLEDGGVALRGVHAKSHGLLQGELHVLPLPPELAQGMFEQPGSYPIVMRFSTSPGDLLPDSVSSPRGLAIKVIGVEGERLADAAGKTQDFVMANGPAFTAATAKKFLGNLKMLAATTDRAEGAKKVLSAALRGLESVIEGLGAKSGLVTSMGGQPAVNILGETFYSQTAFMYGPYMAKFSIAPVSPELTALTGAKVDLGASPDILRDTVREFFATHGGEWELRVQLCTDLDTMPVEDPTTPWPEDASPYVPVARLEVGPQPSWNEARAAAVDGAMAFSPWHGLAAHRPLGSVNRVRKGAYESSSEFRSTHGGCPIHEPSAAPTLPA